MLDLSVVIPMLNEEAVVEELLTRVQAAVDALEITHEIIVIDDGSHDQTGVLARAAGARVLTAGSPSGQLRATLWGLSRATGDHVAVLDGDLQDPPEVLVDLWHARQGVDVVFAVKSSRDASGLFRLGRQAYASALRTIGAPMPPSAGSYLLATASVARRAVALDPADGNLAVVAAIAADRHASVPYHKDARRVGQSRVGAWGLAREAIASLWLAARYR